MIKYRFFTYKRIIVLTIQRIQELESLLHKHCDSIDYKATTKNEAEIYFESFDELSSFCNFGEDKIVALHLKCRLNSNSDFSIEIDFSPKFPHSDCTVRCFYCFSDIDEESIFISDFKKFLDKTAIYNARHNVCEWLSFAFFFLLGLYPIIIPIGGAAFYQAAKNAVSLVSGALMIETVALFLYALFSKFVLQKLYPRVIYAWGEETEKEKKLESLRSNLFWAVLIATVINIITGLFLK